MVPMPSIEARGNYTEGERRTLLQLAVRSLEHGLARRAPWLPSADAHPGPLQAHRASFVTLELEQALRGCIGVLEASRPLALDVAQNAYAAAFEDPRFPPLTAAELDGLDIHVSVLSPPERLKFRSRDDLLAQIRPGIDGLILEDHGHRGTFLPSVWDQLESPLSFFAHLLMKAGLPREHWSETLAISRYTTESFGAPVAALRQDRRTT